MYLQASGIEVKDECTAAFEEIKLKHTLAYVVYKISDDKKSIEVEDKVEMTEEYKGMQGYKNFVDKLDNKTPRYYVYSFCYTLKEGGERDKLVFIPW